MEAPMLDALPEPEQLPDDPDMQALHDGCKKALEAVPVHFTSPINIEGIDAGDLFSLSSLLGSAIEGQVTTVLNANRMIWDPDEQWTEWEFRRYPESFPDVRLVDPQGDVAFGIELKSWYLLTKEKVPTFRFTTTVEACSPWDLLVVYPWALANVISGKPVTFSPFIAQARHAAMARTYYWQHRQGDDEGRDIRISVPDSARPYAASRSKISDKALSDTGRNFGRIFRIKGFSLEWTEETLNQKLAGIETRFWIEFLALFKEGYTQDQVEKEITRIAKQVAKRRPEAAELELIEHMAAIAGVELA